MAGFDSEVSLVRDAARRTRWTVAALTVCAMCHLVVFFNGNLSWMKQYGDAPRWMFADGLEKSEIQRKLHELYLEKWVDSIYVDVPILGVQVAGSDTSVFGSLAMVVLSVWVFFASRRENHLVHLVLADARNTVVDPASRRELLRGIVASQVLSPTSDDDTPYEAFRHPLAGRKKAHVPRAINRALRYLPCSVIAAGVMFDLYTAWSRGFLLNLSGRLAPMMVVATACAIVCGILAYHFARFQRSTAKLVRSFAVEIDKLNTKPSFPPLRPTPPAPSA